MTTDEQQTYYVSYRNAIYGPYTVSELGAFLTPGTLVCRTGEDAWHAASDIKELGDILAVRETGLEPDHPPGQLYYVERDGKEYGPYSLEQLKEFVSKSTKLRIGNGVRWVSAGDLEELREFFMQPVIPGAKYWFYYDAGGKEYGPFSRRELVEKIRTGVITPEMEFKHFSWNMPVLLRESKLYRDLTQLPEQVAARQRKRNWFLVGLVLAGVVGVLAFLWYANRPPAPVVISTPTVSPTAVADTAPSDEGVPASHISGTEIFAEVPNALAASPGTLVVRMADVGQGDAFVVQTPGGKTYLIDAGSSAQRALIPYLHKLGVTEIAGVMMSHPHADHVGGVDEILDEFPVAQLYDAGYPHTSWTYRKVLEMALAREIDYSTPVAGDVLDWGDSVQVRVYHPDVPEYDNLNNNSIVCKLVYGTTSVLFTGDAEYTAEQKVLERYADELDVDILKVGHHGSHSSTSREWLAAVRPAIALISCGLGNSYGHPHQETLRNLSAAGATVYRTDRDGFVRLESDGSHWDITVEGTLYDKVRYRFAPPPVYRVDLTNLDFLNQRSWSEHGPPQRAEVGDDGLILRSEPEERIYEGDAPGPLLLKRPEFPDKYVAIIKMRGSAATATDGAVVAFGDEQNWVALSCAEGDEISLTNCRDGRRATEYFPLKTAPLYYAMERYGDKLNIAVSSDCQNWVVLYRYNQQDLGFALDALRLGLGANSWGDYPAEAWFFDYAEYRNE